MLHKSVDWVRNVRAGADGQVEQFANEFLIAAGEIDDDIVLVCRSAKGVAGIERKLDGVAVKHVIFV